MRVTDAPSKLPYGNGETVLIVEDNPESAQAFGRTHPASRVYDAGVRKAAIRPINSCEKVQWLIWSSPIW